MYPSDTAVISLALPLIREYEGFRPKAYLCPAGIPTIAYGATSYADGRKVELTDPAISAADGEALLRFHCGKVLNNISQAWDRQPGLHQAAAMLCLAFNIGTGAFKLSTLLKQFNKGNIESAANHFLDWTKARVDGKLVELPGLKARRQSERALFLS